MWWKTDARKRYTSCFLSMGTRIYIIGFVEEYNVKANNCCLGAMVLEGYVK